MCSEVTSLTSFCKAGDCLSAVASGRCGRLGCEWIMIAQGLTGSNNRFATLCGICWIRRRCIDSFSSFDTGFESLSCLRCFIALWCDMANTLTRSQSQTYHSLTSPRFSVFCFTRSSQRFAIVVPWICHHSGSSLHCALNPVHREVCDFNLSDVEFTVQSDRCSLSVILI